MNHVLTDSRGVGLQKFLEELLPEGSKECTEVHINSGKGYKVMREKALALLPPPYRQRSRSHVYFVCGICDITEMFRSPTQNYKETVMVLSPEAVFEKVAAEINDCRQAILKAGALPIFATIPRINLAIYNNYVLNHPKPDKRTKFLYTPNSIQTCRPEPIRQSTKLINLFATLTDNSETQTPSSTRPS